MKRENMPSIKILVEDLKRSIDTMKRCKMSSRYEQKYLEMVKKSRNTYKRKQKEFRTL